MNAPAPIGSRVLVTGAGGFLGAQVVQSLLSEGRTVVAQIRPAASPGRLSSVLARITLVHADITDSVALTDLFRTHSPDVVINAAAYGVDPRQSEPTPGFDVNFGGMVRLFEAGAKAGLRRFIQIGSCFEYGDISRPARETDPVRPKSVYAASKAAAAMAVEPLARALGIEAVVLRLFGFWGPGEAAGRLVPQIVKASKGRARLALTAGEQIRDLSFVRDVSARVAAFPWISGFTRYGIVNIGSGRAVSIRSFAESVASPLNGKDLLDFGGLPYRADESRYLVADVSRQTELFGNFPETPVEIGVKQMLEQPTA